MCSSTQEAKLFVLTESRSIGSNVVRGRGNCDARLPSSGKDAWVPQGWPQLDSLPLEVTEKKIMPLDTGLKF